MIVAHSEKNLNKKIHESGMRVLAGLVKKDALETVIRFQGIGSILKKPEGTHLKFGKHRP